MTVEIDGLKDWIAKVEREGIARHSESVERMAVLERDRDEDRKRDLLLDKKVDAILDILSQGRGVLTLLRLVGWCVAVGSGIALIYEAISRHRGH